MQLFLCDLELDAIEELLPDRRYDVAAVVAELGIDISPWRAEKELEIARAKSSYLHYLEEEKKIAFYEKRRIEAEANKKQS